MIKNLHGKVNSAQTTEILRRLVAINSGNPEIGGGPGEREIASEIETILRSIGIKVDIREIRDKRPNVIGILEGSGGGRNMMLNGHMDTVGVHNMEIPPFDPAIRDGRLYGRGSSDMKGGLAAMISAVLAVANSGVKLRGDVYLAAVIDEEYESIGTETLVSDAKYKVDGVIVCEPTNLSIVTTHMGFAWIEIETFGRSAHGSSPEKGQDAIFDMVKILNEIDGSMRPVLNGKSHSLLGTPKLHASSIAGGSGWSLVPDHCVFQLETRVLPGETAEDDLRLVDNCIESAKSKYPSLRATSKLKFKRLPLDVSSDSEICEALKKGVNKVTGKGPQFSGVAYWSDAALFPGKTQACLYGPGDIALAHSPVEYVSIEDVNTAAQVYARTLEFYCG